jgi:hypothetical protein
MTGMIPTWSVAIQQTVRRSPLGVIKIINFIQQVLIGLQLFFNTKGHPRGSVG